MRHFQNISSIFKDNAIKYWNIYQTDKIIKMCQKGNYKKVITKIPTIEKYQQFSLSEFPLIYYLISENHEEMLEKLLNLNYKDQIIQDFTNPQNITPIIFALINEKQDAIEILKKQGADILQTGYQKNTLIHYGCMYNKLDIVKLGIENNISLNQQNEKGDVFYKYQDSITLFNYLRKFRNNKLFIKLRSKCHDLQQCKVTKQKDGVYPLYEACVSKNIDIMKLLYFSAKQIRDSKKMNYDVIHIASQNESAEMLEYLLQQTPSFVNLEDNPISKASPLHYAAISKSSECTRFLIKKEGRINQQDQYGNTPMHYAVINQDIPTIEVLAEFNADLAVKNQDFMSPLDICYSENYTHIIKIFRALYNYADHFKPKNF